MSKAEILVSAVAVLGDHAAILPAFIEEVGAVLDQHYSNYEIVLIDNGSTDGTEKIARQMLSVHKCVRYLRLTRRTDHETAIMAGLDAVIGDYVVTLHPDFDPPAEIVPLVDGCRSGNDLVLGVDKQPCTSGPVYRALRYLFLSMYRRLIGIEFVTGATGLRCLTRQAVNALVKVRLRRRFFPLVATDLGLRTVVHCYNRMSRSGQHPKPDLFRAVRGGMSILVHNSITPLRLASSLGIFGSLLSFFYSIYVIAIYLFKSDVMPGWTTLSLLMSGLFAFVFLMLALMGEYLGRLLEESPDRPLYHVRDEQSSAILLSDLNRRNVLDRSEVPESELRGGAS